MGLDRKQLRLYLVTNSDGKSEEEFLKALEEAIGGGVSFVQIREKNKTTAEYIDLVSKALEITRKHNVPLVVDDRVDVVLATGADGVHVGRDDMPVETARKILGKDKIVGATTKTVEQALAAYKAGADYLGVGAIYPTTTKVKTVLTSTDTLNDICNAVPIPANAIGGLNKDNLGVLKGIPIAGVCVVSAIMKADDPRKAAAELVKAIEEL
ncbi:thiamine phosphate synthase [Butyrivibrio sp. INlla21]|uniref:thiamine phosphate synthase n=1 Tax=Butyrivibrio sp. INlla21 TaxID=1520811 RepID=UPI0008E39F7F|nr:thiamine phosphate synthase [Butyrivibrio sp. INlla21]SFU93431.1 thiamine-phosphate pyrophosphorylase [Butyrivibrio sp. INlla21]